MSDESRGEAIKQRRLALGIDDYVEFAEETGRDRDTLSRAERGKASQSTMEWLESWLDRREGARPGDPDASGRVEVELHDVYGVGQIIARGDPDQVADAVAKILERLREHGDA